MSLRFINPVLGSMRAACSANVVLLSVTTLRLYMPVLVATRSKASVCRRALAEIVGSNPNGGHGCCFVLSGRGFCDELVTRPEDQI
jgi:hypothetical protein